EGIMWRRRAHPTLARRTRAVIVVALVTGVAFAALGMTRGGWRELLDENMEKLQLVSMVEPAIADYAAVGMGRGAFESVFAAYQTSTGHVVFTHIENFVAQWLVEWGVAVGALAVLAFVFLFRPKRLGATRDTTRA